MSTTKSLVMAHIMSRPSSGLSRLLLLPRQLGGLVSFGRIGDRYITTNVVPNRTTDCHNDHLTSLLHFARQTSGITPKGMRLDLKECRFARISVGGCEPSAKMSENVDASQLPMESLELIVRASDGSALRSTRSRDSDVWTTKPFGNRFASIQSPIGTTVSCSSRINFPDARRSVEAFVKSSGIPVIVSIDDGELQYVQPENFSGLTMTNESLAPSQSPVVLNYLNPYKIASFSMSYILNYRFFFIFMAQTTFQALRPLLAFSVFGEVMKMALASMTSGTVVFLFSFVLAFEVFYFFLQCYISYTFLSMFFSALF